MDSRKIIKNIIERESARCKKQKDIEDVTKGCLRGHWEIVIERK